MQEKTGISQRRACRLVGRSHTVLAYAPRAKPANEAIKARMIEVAAECRRFGYQRLHVLLRREGRPANPKRVSRLYLDAKLAMPKRTRRRGIAVAPPAHAAGSAKPGLVDGLHDGCAIQWPSPEMPEHRR
jgi:putative transposase